jgi:hypothetical protein
MRLSMHTAQASTKASFDTRYHNCIFGVLMISTAIEMVHLKVACCVRPALGSLHNMADIPRGALCDWLLTGRTHAILPSPDTIELPVTSRRVQHFLAPSGLEVLFPFGVMGIGVRFNLDMPLYWRIRFLQQDEISLRSILYFFCSGKYPLPGASGFKVLILNPAGSFIWMPSYRPSP